MTIENIEVYAYNIPMDAFAISLGTMYEANNVLVKINTIEGIIGWGEGAPFSYITGETQGTCLALAKDFALLWKGKNALHIEARMNELHDYAPWNTTIKSAFDMALYDIAAQHAQQPLYKFLGGNIKDIFTDATIGVHEPEIMASKAIKLKESNAPFIKVKLGKHNNAEKDILRIAAIRKAIGNDIPLRLDANQGWSVHNATTILNAVQHENIQFCEQPVKWHDIEGMATIAAASPIPIMADESCFNALQATQLIEAKACHYINIKLAKSSGIFEAIKIATIAKQHNMQCMLGGMLESRLAMTANAHFACAFDNIVFFDLDTCFLLHIDEVEGGINYEAKNAITLPKGIGLGASINKPFLDHCVKFNY